jgi:hypothetical protein
MDFEDLRMAVMSSVGGGFFFMWDQVFVLPAPVVERYFDLIKPYIFPMGLRLDSLDLRHSGNVTISLLVGLLLYQNINFHTCIPTKLVHRVRYFVVFLYTYFGLMPEIDVDLFRTIEHIIIFLSHSTLKSSSVEEVSLNI